VKTIIGINVPVTDKVQLQMNAVVTAEVYKLLCNCAHWWWRVQRAIVDRNACKL
jgi:hypothetical protein